MYIVRCPTGDRWKVREAVSLKEALNEIAHAKVTGSVGSASYLAEAGRPQRCLANVVRLNSDNTERQPYTEAY
jgi:hypothetical protein